MVWSNKTVRKKHYSAEDYSLTHQQDWQTLRSPAVVATTYPRCENVCRGISQYISLKFWVNKPGLGASTLGFVT